MSRVVFALWRRELFKFGRDRNRVAGALLQPAAVWLLLGFGFRDSFQVPGQTDVPFLEFLFPGILALVALFTSIFSTISIVEERKSGFLQAALASPAPRSTLVLGTVAGGTTLGVLQAALFFVLLPLIGRPISPGGLALLLAGTLLIGAAFTALGVVIAWRTSTTRGFHAVMNLFLLPLWALSGAFFPIDGAPALLRWIIRVNPVSYGVDLLRQAMYLPDSSPLAIAPIAGSLAVAGVFAAGVYVLAVRTVNRPLG